MSANHIIVSVPMRSKNGRGASCSHFESDERVDLESISKLRDSVPYQLISDFSAKLPKFLGLVLAVLGPIFAGK